MEIRRPKGTPSTVAWFLATGFLSGYTPKAPGTAGALVAVGILWALGPVPPLAPFIALCLVTTLIGAWACQRSGTHLGETDASQIVIDEIAGMFISMIGIPLTGYWLLVGFLLFRLFDIVKPPPAKFFDTRVKNGWGVMLDDVVAGAYVNLLLQLMLKAQI